MQTIIDLLKSIGDGGTGEGDDEARSVGEEDSRIQLIAGERTYDPRRFVQTVYKTGNYLRHCGVHDGTVVEIVPVAAPETLFGIFGTALLEGRISFDVGNAPDTSVRLGPTEQLAGNDIPPGCTAIGFGKKPEDPSWAYFEREIWSENPFFPPVEIDPTRPFLEWDEESRSFQELLEQAQSVAQTLDGSDTVAIRAPLYTPGVLTCGMIAPLLSGAAILLPEGEQTGTVAVTDGEAPESRTIDPTERSGV